jgi:hypothetical protein
MCAFFASRHVGLSSEMSLRVGLEEEKESREGSIHSAQTLTTEEIVRRGDGRALVDLRVSEEMDAFLAPSGLR